MCFNNKNQLEGKEGFLYDDNFTTVCFESGDEYIKTSTGVKKGANSGTNWDYNYSLNLLESYIFLSKINYNKFPSSLEKYIYVFSEEGNELVIGHEKREIGKKQPFVIYDKNNFSEVNKKTNITFTYTPKVISKKGKNFIEVSIVQKYNSQTEKYEKKNFLIDLKSILTDPEFSY